MTDYGLKLLFILPFVVFVSSTGRAQNASLKAAYAATLVQLADVLLDHQLKDKKNPDFGALQCDYDKVLHTRASEAVYPFAIAYKITGSRKYLDAAIRTGNWLIKQQEPNGSWKETPEEWTGTTTDQALMLILAWDHLAGRLGKTEKASWRNAIIKAADYLHKTMTPEFASINYVATTCATLASAARLLKDEKYSRRAKELAHRTISKMDEDGFLNGEGGRTHANKLGTDLGYSMEMSLWGLGLYAKLTGDTLVNNAVKHALKSHLYFIYPDGSMDNSWGIRSNKWTTYGGATSDGCQVLFSLYADEDPRYASASLKNLQYLRKNILASGLIAYGPQHEEVMDFPPCIYPTFTKAKNLAMAYELEKKQNRTLAKLPSEATGWVNHFKTVNVALLRTANFMATVTSYGYKDYKAGAKSKYMYRPAGGAISSLWVKGHGYLTASSVTEYSRPEPMSFPEVPGVKSLTPRIAFTDSLGYFTNLFEFDSRMEVKQGRTNRFEVSVSGELKDRNWLAAGVGYRMNYQFSDSAVVKTIRLIYHDARPVIKIIEPIIHYKGMVFTKTDAQTILIKAGDKLFRFKLLSGDAVLNIGKDAEHYWAPYPALKAFPLELELKPAEDSFTQEISYELSVVRMFSED
ncbi:hypothetical protein CCY01nite_28350 [Chitinophaga cymbidii]|uniref:Uncharacterized protein n=1 Tax=Chitinophaga cymbidii TaxID=1096750 RepID=A0A512RLI9_9BACT|nr:hypothetical protein CCY01nite_28350 [Chitinophaga cymbidii]